MTTKLFEKLSSGNMLMNSVIMFLSLLPLSPVIRLLLRVRPQKPQAIQIAICITASQNTAVTLPNINPEGPDRVRIYSMSLEVFSILTT